MIIEIAFLLVSLCLIQIKTEFLEPVDYVSRTITDPLPQSNGSRLLTEFPELSGFIHDFQIINICKRGMECQIEWHTDDRSEINLSPTILRKAQNHLPKVSISLIKLDRTYGNFNYEDGITRKVAMKKPEFVGHIMKQKINLRPSSHYRMAFKIPIYFEVGKEYSPVLIYEYRKRPYVIKIGKSFILHEDSNNLSPVDFDKFYEQDEWERFFVMKEILHKSDPRGIVEFCNHNPIVHQNCQWILKKTGIGISVGILKIMGDIITSIEKLQLLLIGYPEQILLTFDHYKNIQIKFSTFWNLINPFNEYSLLELKMLKENYYSAMESILQLGDSFIFRLQVNFPKLQIGFTDEELNDPDAKFPANPNQSNVGIYGMKLKLDETLKLVQNRGLNEKIKYEMIANNGITKYSLDEFGIAIIVPWPSYITDSQNFQDFSKNIFNVQL